MDSLQQLFVVEFGPLGKIGPPLRGYCFGRTGFNFGRKKWLAPLKNAPKYFYFIKRLSGDINQEEGLKSRLHIRQEAKVATNVL